MLPIIGHAHILDFFSRVIANGRLSHAYIFSGPAHLGKRSVAERIIRDLFTMGNRSLATNPDIAILEQEFDEKKERTKMNVDAGQMRGLVNFLSLKSFLGGKKCAIIDDAEKLNDDSANILLKTLEEPSGDAVIFLIASDTSAIPGTILSRCQTIYFQPVPSPLLADGLARRGLGALRARELSEYSSGAPGTAIHWMNDDDAYRAFLEEKTRFDGLLGKSFAEKLRMTEDFFKDRDDHIAARARLEDTVWLWQVWCRALVLSGTWGSRRYLEVSARIAEARRYLSQNVHPRLLVEEILLALP